MKSQTSNSEGYTILHVINCVVVDCPPTLCPEGQTPFCQGAFEYDEVTERCILPEIYTGATVGSNGCVWVDRLNGDCPGVAMDVMADQCLLQCFMAGSEQVPFVDGEMNVFLVPICQ